MLTDQEIEAIFGFNPAPGSPSVMWDLQHRVADRASTLTAASDGLNGVAVDTWIGHGADSFEGTLGNLRRDVHTAAEAHGDYASAVYAYVSEQESARTQTQSLAQQALQAHQTLQAALNQVTRYSTVPSNETDAARTDREQNLRQAHGQASTAQGDFDAIVRRARSLQGYMDGVAAQAARRINAAAELAPYEQPGWLQQAWSDVTNAAGAVWTFVSSPEFLHDLSTVLNIVSAVCAFIPGLQGVAIAAALIAVGVDVLAKLAAGEPINLLDVALDVGLAVMPMGRVARLFRGIPPEFRGAVIGAALGGATSAARDVIDGRGLSATDVLEGAALGAGTALIGEKLSSQIQGAGQRALAEADAAQSIGRNRRPAMASGMTTPDGQTFGGTSVRGGGSTQLHPDLQAALESVPANQREPWHAQCAEIQTINSALNSGMTPQDLNGSVISAVQVRNTGDPAHGIPRDPCRSCQPVLDFFGIRAWPPT
ncbi:MAG TPA: YwqJ-related putative deaminase [Candidatus Dormibacteraeota bacterium]|nr:YwqJ-related putative deaminase [Candidatus Dormibacteraeota bacterium]